MDSAQSKRNNTICVGILSILILTGVYFAYSGWKDMKEGAYLSCLSSIANEVDKNKSLLVLESNKKWKVLSEKETDEIPSKIQPYDCGNTSNPSFDLWNNKIQIAGIKSKKDIEIIVWSKSYDGISRTEDDLVTPYGKIPPK